MSQRLEAVEVVRLDAGFTQDESQAFIENWNANNPEKYNNPGFMPLFSYFIERCELVKGEDRDTLSVTMLVSPEQWPSRQEIANITFFIKSLANDFDNLTVTVFFEVYLENEPESSNA